MCVHWLWSNSPVGNVLAESLSLEVDLFDTGIREINSLLEGLASRTNGQDTATVSDGLLALDLGARVEDVNALGEGRDADGYALWVLARVALRCEDNADGEAFTV